ncbi:protein GlmU [Chlorella sorokiniana]|uniref:Protein GlmU n=1 Tax=Chlorella sorokiniana TaxID=3076 RepID=A0A2P6TSC0_CHLSO|nr:protein GlmU [Chlorella sorokiniana]|eukprot:PRW56956.1 protein GlmU [Chlorella sorokiniana]
MPSPCPCLIKPQQTPTNCSSSGDSWGRDKFVCSIPPAFTAQCVIATPPAPSGNVHCSVINDEKPNIQTGLTCPVKGCVSVCDLVVMQNFFPPDLVTSFVELLAAWKPSVPGC